MVQKKIYPLSNPQKMIWSTEKMYPGTSISNNAGTLSINGILNFEVMEKAINTFLQKNDSIRLRISFNDEHPAQYISPYEYYNLDVLDFSDSNGNEALYKWEENITSMPFDLIDSRLYYFALLKINQKESAVYCKAHHIITDAWSIVLMGNKILELYNRILNSDNIDLKKDISYIEYVLDEENYIKSERFQKNKDFWEEKFSSIPELIYLKPYDALSISTSAMRKGFLIDHQLSEKINIYCKEYKTSPYTFFMSLLSVYLHRVKGKNDMVLGTTILNRSNKAQKETVGMFATVVPVRLFVDDTVPFGNYIHTVSQELKAVLRNQRYPLSHILNAFREKNRTLNNLFDIGLTYHTAKFDDTESLNKLKLRWHPYNHQTNSLNIHISDREGNENYVLNFDYRTDVFLPEEIIQMYGHINVLLKDILDNPQKTIRQLNILSNEEQYKILNQFNSTKIDYPRDKTIHELFEEQVKRAPDRIAVICEEKELSYLELNRLANQIAWALKLKDVKPETVVGIMVKRSPEMIAGIMGILKAGGAYLPIDPSYPSERIEYILKDSNTRILITDSPVAHSLAGAQYEVLDIKNPDLYKQTDTDDLLITMNPNQLAYLIYTSGSTGRPKGTLIEHRSVCNFIESISGLINICDYETILALTTISFDIFVLETLLPLSKGLKVIIATENEQVDTMLLGNLV
ncbi:MAG: condensation domain-containing protein, partial [Bacillota bacterium]|nr:condensation domain-containing protein [Bacillota bacterium]